MNHKIKGDIAAAFVVLTGVIATSFAYVNMVGVGTATLGLPLAVACALAGVLEVATVAFALLARREAKADMPSGRLEFISLVLAGLSGWIASHHAPTTDTRILFALVPLVGFLAWHFLLKSDRRAASGMTVSDARARRFETFRRAVEYIVASRLALAARRAQRDPASKRARRRLYRAQDAAELLVRPERMPELREVRAAGAHAVDGFAEAVQAAVTPPPVEAVTAVVTDPATPGPTTRPRPPAKKSAKRPAKKTATTPAKADRVPVLADLLADQPDATTATGVAALAAAGHDVPDRTVRRDMAELKTKATETTETADMAELLPA